MVGFSQVSPPSTSLEVTDFYYGQCSLTFCSEGDVLAP